MNSPNEFYPGNRDLPVEVKNRVASTFRQAVDLFRQGRIDEVTHGCDLILQMDPAFVPARKLIEKLKNPAAPIDIEALTAGFGGGEDRLSAARQALAARDFRKAVELSSDLLRRDLTNEEAQKIGQEAQEKIEAEPFVEQFLARARTHLAGGNTAAAKSDVEKARTLDADHPMIRQIENTLATMQVSAPAPPPAAAPTHSFDFGAGSAAGSFDFQGAAPDTGSSFIVDAPAAARSSTQASDFGFAFEEDASTPGSAPVSSSNSAVVPEVNAGFPLGEAQTFDFSTVNAEVSDDDQHRIDQYLQDGDQAFGSGDYQRATEIWSRIFLIDVTHAGASERIERARKKQLEIEEKVDAIESDAMALLKAGSTEEARSRFEEILRLDPGNQKAAEQLEQLGGERPVDLAFGETASAAPEEHDIFSEEAFASSFGLPAEISSDALLPESSSSASALARPPVALAPPKRRGGMLVVALALLVLGVAGYFAFTKFMGGRKSAATLQDAQLILTRAKALARQGRFDEGIALLASVRPDNPDRDKALALMAELRNQKAAGPQTVDGRPAMEVFRELLAQGQTAFAARDFIGTKRAFEAASKIRPLPSDIIASYQIAQQQVAKLQSALALFQEGEYPSAINVLQGMAEQDPDNPNIRQLLNDAHYNIGANALREDKLSEAIAEFDKVLQSNPNDEAARRSREIAARYQDQSKDLLFRIYVKYLPLR